MKIQLISLLFACTLLSCGRKEMPPFEVFVKQGDRIMKAMDQELSLAANDFTLLFTFGQLDSTQPYGIQWVASAEADVIEQFQQTKNLSALNIPFSDTLLPATGQLITQQPVLMQYNYALDAAGKRSGNFSRAEEKFQQLLLEVTVDTINGQPTSDGEDRTIGLFISPVYEHMPMEPFYITLHIGS